MSSVPQARFELLNVINKYLETKISNVVHVAGRKMQKKK